MPIPYAQNKIHIYNSRLRHPSTQNRASIKYITKMRCFLKEAKVFRRILFIELSN